MFVHDVGGAFVGFFFKNLENVRHRPHIFKFDMLKGMLGTYFLLVDPREKYCPWLFTVLQNHHTAKLYYVSSSKVLIT